MSLSHCLPFPQLLKDNHLTSFLWIFRDILSICKSVPLKNFCAFSNIILFFKIILCIDIFIFDCTGSPLLCGLSLVAGNRGYFLVVVRRFLIAMAPLDADHRLEGMLASVTVAHGLSNCSSKALEHRLSRCGTRAYLLHSMWDVSQPGIKPISLALASRFFTIEPWGKPVLPIFKHSSFFIELALWALWSFDT